MPTIKALAAATLLLTLPVSLAGCSNDDPATSGTDSSPGSTDFNGADVTFAQDMIPHHQQAVQMAQMAEARAESEEVRTLAADIEAAQAPEIDQMSSWLEAWGEDVPDDTMMEGMDHGDTEMPGMMDDEEMGMLEDSTGPAFDRMFLTSMIEHHEGAIEMAQTEQADGQNPDATALAEKIEADQRAEIDTMEQLLAGM